MLHLHVHRHTVQVARYILKILHERAPSQTRGKFSNMYFTEQWDLYSLKSDSSERVTPDQENRAQPSANPTILRAKATMFFPFEACMLHPSLDILSLVCFVGTYHCPLSILVQSQMTDYTDWRCLPKRSVLYDTQPLSTNLCCWFF